MAVIDVDNTKTVFKRESGVYICATTLIAVQTISPYFDALMIGLLILAKVEFYRTHFLPLCNRLQALERSRDD